MEGEAELGARRDGRGFADGLRLPDSTAHPPAAICSHTRRQLIVGVMPGLPSASTFPASRAAAGLQGAWPVNSCRAGPHPGRPGCGRQGWAPQ